MQKVKDVKKRILEYLKKMNYRVGDVVSDTEIQRTSNISGWPKNLKDCEIREIAFEELEKEGLLKTHKNGYEITEKGAGVIR